MYFQIVNKLDLQSVILQYLTITTIITSLSYTWTFVPSLIPVSFFIYLMNEKVYITIQYKQGILEMLGNISSKYLH